jgi:hypothetical protein
VLVSFGVCGILLVGAEGFGRVVIPLAALLMLHSLLSAGCSLPQFGHLSWGQGVFAVLQVGHV